MRSTCTGRHWAVLPCLGTLAACGEAAPGAAAFGFAALALGGGAAVLAYLLGAQRARNTLESALREANSRNRELAALADDWAWSTDPEHHLLAWQGPGRAAEPQCLLFDDAALAAKLQAQRPFAMLRVSLASPLDGWRHWELRGTPRVDALGRFAGFSGAARPLDERESAQAAAAGLPAALQAAAGVALLLQDAGDGWRVHRFNSAAAARWPALEAGQDLATLAGGWPEGLRAALAGPVAADAEVDGWRLLPFGPLPGGARGLVLAQAAAPAASASAAEGAPQAESDSFSFTVSHDLRAPIRVVEGFTRIVKEDYGRLLDRVGNDHLDRVLGAAARMNLMIDALLTLARLSSQPLARQPVNLSQLAGYVVDDLRRGAPEREAEIEIQPGLHTQGDPTLLRLVLENLLGNAWKYSARTPRAQISLSTVVHAGRMAYVVRDNGAGFDMRSAERLFGLFQRLHSASEFPGHGVGLASVRRIVQRHGGQIWAEAEPGKGAAFFFTLAG